MPEILYTLGYQQRSLEEFLRLLVQARIDVLIDVRETAWSHKPGFSKGSFSVALERAGIEYIHADFAGNPRWLRSNADSHNECLSWYRWYLDEYQEVIEAFDALLASLHAAGKTVCITCFERHAEDCHRSILAERWGQLGSRSVQHLATDGCERLLQI
jgi:uncharacterized protein (DUF488 family)